MLTATHHSHGSPRLYDFFLSRLWASDPSTDLHAKWLKRRVSKSLSLTDSEIFHPKHHVLIDTMLNRHFTCAYHVTCTPYVKFKYIFEFLTLTLPIHCVIFIELRWRIRGVLSVTSNVKGQIERKTSKSKNLLYFDLWGTLEIRGYEKLRFLLQKAQPCVKPRRFSHFSTKSVGGLTSSG